METESSYSSSASRRNLLRFTRACIAQPCRHPAANFVSVDQLGGTIGDRVSSAHELRHTRSLCISLLWIRIETVEEDLCGVSTILHRQFQQRFQMLIGARHESNVACTSRTRLLPDGQRARLYRGARGGVY